MTVARSADRVLYLLEVLFAGVAALLVATGVMSVVFEVTARAVADRSFPLVLDLNAIFVLYVPFLAGAYVLRRGGHITVDLLVPRAGGILRRVADSFVALVGIAVSAVLTWFGAILTLEAYRRGLSTLGIVRIPEWCVIGAIPLGGVLFTLEFLRQFLHAITGRPVEAVRGARESIEDPRQPTDRGE